MGDYVCGNYSSSGESMPFVSRSELEYGLG